MDWEHHKGFDVLVINDEVVGHVGPVADYFAAAMQGGHRKTCRTRERGRLYVERRATEHHRKMCLETHKKDPEFTPNYRDLNRREREAGARRAAIRNTPF